MLVMPGGAPLTGGNCRFHMPAHDTVATNHRGWGRVNEDLGGEAGHRRNSMCQSIFSVQDDA